MQRFEKKKMLFFSNQRLVSFLGVNFCCRIHGYSLGMFPRAFTEFEANLNSLPSCESPILSKSFFSEQINGRSFGKGDPWTLPICTSQKLNSPAGSFRARFFGDFSRKSVGNKNEAICHFNTFLLHGCHWVWMKRCFFSKIITATCLSTNKLVGSEVHKRYGITHTTWICFFGDFFTVKVH